MNLMRSYIKTNEQIELMRKAGTILVDVINQLFESIIPGHTTTLELDQLAYDLIKKHNADPAFLNFAGYPNSVCISLNHELVHGLPSDVVIKDSDMVTIDLGVDYQGWKADAADTRVIGKSTREQRKIIKVCNQALESGIKQCKAGNYVGDISAAIEDVIKPSGFHIIKTLSGHGIGQALHELPEIPNYGSPQTGDILQNGMTLCIEPMIAAGNGYIQTESNTWTISTIDKAISTHCERTILIQDDNPCVLTPI